MSGEKNNRKHPSPPPRHIGDAPALGRVSRTHSASQPATRPRSSRGKRRHTTLLARSALLLIAITLATIAIILLYPTQKETTPQATTPAPLEEKEAFALVRKALETPHPHPTGAPFLPTPHTPALLAQLTSSHASEGEITHLTDLGEIYTNGRTHREILVHRENKQRATNRIAILLPAAQGKWHIDLEAYLRTTTPSWEDILAHRTKTATVRVFITKSTYYNGIYSDDTTWQSYTLISPDVTEILHAYAKRSSPQHTAITTILQAGNTPPRITLSLHIHPQAGTRQFEITRILAQDWSISEKPFDQAF